MIGSTPSDRAAASSPSDGLATPRGSSHMDERLASAQMKKAPSQPVLRALSVISSKKRDQGY